MHWHLVINKLMFLLPCKIANVYLTCDAKLCLILVKVVVELGLEVGLTMLPVPTATTSIIICTALLAEMKLLVMHRREATIGEKLHKTKRQHPSSIDIILLRQQQKPGVCRRRHCHSLFSRVTRNTSRENHHQVNRNLPVSHRRLVTEHLRDKFVLISLLNNSWTQHQHLLLLCGSEFVCSTGKRIYVCVAQGCGG